ncbi:glycosyl hydrolase family 18 protein [Luteolibacter arcticus]|uniref:chitinase n=1 Tax=Luteolibacter arcticus TaxID=1581411 RepID=A0ABT3GCJ6_9BACT|nr:glycosyl hydrolase family 18 protein [Luteolibacter arcticus]MCW1921346.1 glycosyl hydrolase family 18 protein [Luteolibacter arcticus]
MLRHLLLCLLPLSTLSAQWGANSQPTRTTADHTKRVVGYVTQWDAWKTTSAGLPKQGFLNHLNLDYSQYTHLNFSFFGVANDGSLHSGDYRNQAIYQAGSTQQPAPLLHGDVSSSWDYHLIWGNLTPQWEINATVQAAGFVAFNGGWKHVATGLSGPLPVPYHPPGTAPGILDLAHSKGVKVMAAIGGWSMCKHFPEMAADPVKRARFIADCQKLIALGFDGIDFDWEYPGAFAGMNFTGTNADYANFLTLATELRAAIGSGKEITSAMSASPAKLAGFDWPAMSAVLDSIDLMTYDFEGGWSDFAGHNAQLFPHPGQETTTFACSTSVQYLISQGVPRSKIAMGLGFYGRGVVCNGTAALGAPTVKISKTVQPDGPIVTAADFASWEPFDATPTYQRITQLMGSGWTRHWDDVAKVPYLTKGTSFLSYDDSRSIGHKAAYVRDQNLGGVIVWHAFGDLRADSATNDKLPFNPNTDAPLINVVNSVLAGDAIPAEGTEGPSPAGGPLRGLPTLPSRALAFGYLNALRNENGQDQVIADLPAALDAANLEAFDVIITAFAEPKSDGTIGTGLGAFSSCLPAVVAEGHSLDKSVVVSIGGAAPASLATQFATIAASPALRQTFSNNVVAFLDDHDLDGVDIDYEFPADATARANFTLLMQTLYATVKAEDPRYIVMFGGGPGWFMGSFDFAALHPHCDFFFYFGYDWKNPANGPMRKPGSVQWTLANDTLPEASVKGGIDYAIGKGFPASKIVCGLPFYGSNNRSWSAVRDTWAANPAAFIPNADSLEVEIGGEWFTPPDAMKRKMDALLSPSDSVLANSAVIRGVGCWEIGHEHASHPDLSTAFVEWIAGEPVDPVDPPLDPDAGWTSHAMAGGLTLTLQVTDDWGTGYQGQLLLNNQTGAALSTWTIQFDAPFTVASMWDGVYGGKSGNTHTASNPTWGGYSLPNNSTGTIGFTGSGTQSQPTNLKLNGNPVGTSGTPFATWATTRGLLATSQSTDSDGDGRANLIEFLNGSNPLTPGSDGPRHEIRSLTVNGVTADYFCLIIPADIAAADVEYRVISSATPAMSPARLMALYGTTTVAPGKLEAVWRNATPLGSRGFARLEARMK